MIFPRETIEPKAALPSISEGLTPPDERKEGDADERYICGLVPILYLCRCPDKFVLCNLSGQKIAATTANSDGWPLIAEK